MYKEFGRKKHLGITVSRAVEVSKVNSILPEIPIFYFSSITTYLLFQMGNKVCWEGAQGESFHNSISAFTIKTHFLIGSELQVW